ncbi:MAG: arsenate reductase ArsC [Nitrosopumilaceae archaeon]|nr:arsenate reductase ArsC [Nitrosopumilaceae archaeon]
MGSSDGAGRKKILFVCVENSARSQMAEGFLRQMAPHIRVQSAGTRPGAHVSPAAVRAMREVGIDISGQAPKEVTREMLAGSTVINMGCMDREACPALFVEGVADWKIDDPEGADAEQVEAIRDQIRDRIRALIGEMGGE